MMLFSVVNKQSFCSNCTKSHYIWEKLLIKMVIGAKSLSDFRKNAVPWGLQKHQQNLQQASQ